MRFLLLATAALLATPAAAQQLEGRVDRLESEMRAVQRKVFPGGAGRLVQPDIQPQVQPPEAGPGVPASTPLTDLTARVTSLEQQIATLTGQTEQNQYRLRVLDESFQEYRRATDARIKALEDRAAAALAPPSVPGEGALPAPGEGVSPTPGEEAAPPADEGTEPVEPDVGTAPEPAAAASVERPDTGNAAEDAYMYGYRLWNAKRYAEAEKQLKQVVAKYPKHRRASYAQNLLGRTYLDQGKPSLASIAFYENYKRDPDGARAPHSLLYLAEALRTLKKPEDACKVYGELTDVYGAKIDARMKADIAQGRAAAECG